MINRRIRKFNTDRGMIDKYDRVKEIECLEEEIDELDTADCWHEEVDALCDIIVFASGALMKLGCDVEDVMSETLKEIESRRQCPIQKLDWELNGSNGAKWQKDRNQDVSTLHKAKYEKVGYGRVTAEEIQIQQEGLANG